MNRKIVTVAVFFCIAAALLPQALFAQSNDDPVIILSATQEAKSSYNYKESVTIVYHLCTAWEGPAGGTAAVALYKKRRSVKGLKPGEMLQFYPSVFSGSCSDSSGCQAEMTSIGDGFYRTTARNKDESKTVDRNRTSSGLPPSTFCSAFILRTTDGAILHIKGLPHVSDLDLGYFHAIDDASAEMTKEQRANFLTWKLSEAELDNWENLNRSQSGDAPGGGKGEHWSYSAAVTAKVPDLGEVAVVIDDYDEWVPEGNVKNASKAGNEITVRAWVCKTGDPETRLNQTAVFTFEFEKVGQEKGVCANWPYDLENRTMRPDLAIDEDRNKDLEMVILDLEAKTKRPVKEAKAIISAFDYGAWGVLKVTAKDKDGKPIRVVYRQRKDSSDISIPKDEDHNHIADAWQEEKGAVGLAADWDEAAVSGQDVKGDGLSLYQKYRGFVVLDDAGGERYVRLDPKEKVHFVIDPNGLLDVNRWVEVTGIRAFKVLEKWTKGRQVDINRGFAGLKGKWATLLIRDDTPVDESLPKDELAAIRDIWGGTYGDEKKSAWGPKDVKYCVVYTGRIRNDLRRYRQIMLRNLTAPRDDFDRAGAALLLSLGIPRDELIARIGKISDASLEALVPEIAFLTALHEVAHSCHVNGHCPKGSAKEDAACETPVASCPMQYLDRLGHYRQVIFGEIIGQGKLCDEAPQHCWRYVSPKD